MKKIACVLSAVLVLGLSALGVFGGLSDGLMLGGTACVETNPNANADYEVATFEFGNGSVPGSFEVVYGTNEFGEGQMEYNGVLGSMEYGIAYPVEEVSTESSDSSFLGGCFSTLSGTVGVGMLSILALGGVMLRKKK